MPVPRSAMTAMLDDADTDAGFDAARYACKPPFPWFGGKTKAAPAVWAALGDVEHYVEPFAGGLAVLLNRPHECNRPYHSETVNDLDGFIVNAWRAIAAKPDAVAEAASWPVSEACKTARQIALLRWRDEYAAEKLAGSADWYDAKMAGWWLWAVAVQIGAFDGRGAWTVDRATGRIVKMPRARGREPGVKRDRPHITNNGQGVSNADLREPGVARSAEPTVDDLHEITMPRLRLWMRLLAARLRHVRILNGGWQRACTDGALRTLRIRTGGTCGVFLDPPYAVETRRDMRLYSAESGTIAHDVRAWCIANGAKPWLRIVLAGWNGEHDELIAHGWRVVEWYAHDSMLSGGISKQGHKERLWLSPSCLTTASGDCMPLFAERAALLSLRQPGAL